MSNYFVKKLGNQHLVIRKDNDGVEDVLGSYDSKRKAHNKFIKVQSPLRTMTKISKIKSIV